MGDTRPYDAVPYESLPYPACHPDAFAVVARLAGLEVRDPAGWRVLDLGCADGGNLLAIAQALPGAECVGIDANAAAIERGRALAAAAGLEVTLEHGDLTGLPDGLGTFDAVIVHGLWSWFGDELRAALPAVLEGLLAPRGIAYVSYHALPGQLLLAPARAIAGRRARGEADPAGQVRAARESFELALSLHPGGGAADVYARLLAAEARRWAQRSDFLVFHDLLRSDAVAFAVEDVAGAMGAAGLAWLGEARPQDWWPWRLDGAAAGRLREAAGEDRVARQQLFDDARGATFNASLFVREEHAPAGDPEAARVLGLRAALAEGSAQPLPATGAQARLLAALTPAPEPVPEILARAGLEPDPAGADALLRLVASGAATLHSLAPAWALAAPERPLASGLARAQAAEGPAVSTLRHGTATFSEDLARALLVLLDGTRDRSAIMAELVARTGMDDVAAKALEQRLDAALDGLARSALLVGR